MMERIKENDRSVVESGAGGECLGVKVGKEVGKISLMLVEVARCLLLFV